MLLFAGSDTPPFGTLDRAHKELNMLTVRKLKVLLHANRVGVVREKSFYLGTLTQKCRSASLRMHWVLVIKTMIILQGIVA